MLVNINEDVLQLLELDDLKDTEDNKILVENVVNSYMVGGILQRFNKVLVTLIKRLLKLLWITMQGKCYYIL